MAAKKTRRVSKKVKTLQARKMSAKRAKGVKGGTIGKWKLDFWRPS
jgi:hypothetical protein